MAESTFKNTGKTRDNNKQHKADIPQTSDRDQSINLQVEKQAGRRQITGKMHWELVEKWLDQALKQSRQSDKE